jgi:hypothetical protein
MKTKLFAPALTAALLASTALFQGCVGLPSLVHVEHKYPADNKEIGGRLDSIEKRISQLEQKSETRSQ